MSVTPDDPRSVFEVIATCDDNEYKWIFLALDNDEALEKAKNSILTIWVDLGYSDEFAENIFNEHYNLKSCKIEEFF